jgi:FK506-binding protein 4/5
MIEIKGTDITPLQDGGVLKEVLVEGTGDEEPFVGDNVIVHYTGTLLDGSKFDSSRDRNEKFKFDIGKGSVIKGWDIGIATMKRGEQARFIIRSDYGYGDGGSGAKIPPKATLVFDVELFDFHGEDLSAAKDQSIIRRVLKAGEGYSTPNEGATVSVHIKGSCQERVFDERDVDFEIGEGSKVDIVEGVEVALQKFKKNEHSKLYLKAKYAWNRVGNEKFGIAPNTDVVYEVTLKNFEKCKESW